ncbi:MAG: glycosyltransferase family 4 protein [Rhodospirillaceae bacterium]
MHIADVTMFYAARSGGIRRYLDVKHAWLRQRAHRHTLVVPDRNGCPADDGTLRLRSVPLPLSGGYRLPVGVSRAAHDIARLRPHIIEAGDPYHLAWAALRARDKLAARAVAFCHSDLPRLLATRYGARAERLAGRYFRRLYREFDMVLAPSAFLVRKLERWGITRVGHQPLGVDTELFHPGRRSDTVRASLASSADARLLVYAGRFAFEKNLPVLIDAVRALGAPYELLLVGAGSLPSPLPANVRVLPFIAQRHRLAAVLASCDAFVHAGDQETFGLAALEAMACGVPVIGANEAGIAEIVTPPCGVLVPPGDADAFAEGIRALFARDLGEMRLQARRVAEGYAWPRLLEQMLQRYQQLAGS